MSKKYFKWELEKMVSRIDEDILKYEESLEKCRKEEEGEWGRETETNQYEELIEQALTEKDILNDVRNNLEYLNDSGTLISFIKENYQAFEVDLFSRYFTEVDLLYYFDEFTDTVKKRIKNIIKDKINKTVDKNHLRELAREFFVESI